MKPLGIILTLVALTGCATTNSSVILTTETAPTLQSAPIDKHVLVDEELRKEWDKKTVKIIKKKRQIVFLHGEWQVMAYCNADDVETVMKNLEDDDAKGSPCLPPKYKNREEVLNAALYVLTKQINKPGRPGTWKVRLENRTTNHLCIHVEWKFIDMQADDFSYGWHYMSPYTAQERGTIKQKTWEIENQEIVFDFWGHVQSLYIRGATNSGECIGDLK